MSASTTDERRPWYRPSLSRQIVLGLVAGTLLGYFSRAWLIDKPASLDSFLDWVALIRDIFLHLIRMMIAPLVFASIVQGIAGHEDMKKVGRIGLKALIYFEVLTGLALVVGLLVVNLLKPGMGVTLSGDTSGLGAITQKPLTVIETILHIFPTSLIDAMARGDVLQIVAFSVIFALAVSVAGDAGKPILDWCESLRQVMFKFAGLIMTFAPFGVGAAIAVTVGHQGLVALLGLGKLVLTLYLALIIFIVFVFGAVIWLVKIPLKPFVRAVREPFTLAFATANSEAALPDAFAQKWSASACRAGSSALCCRWAIRSISTARRFTSR